MSDNKNNEDLDDLLDSALQDFSKTTTKKQEAQNDKPSEASTSNENEGELSEADAFFREHAKNLAENMKSFFGNSEAPSGDMPPLPGETEKLLPGLKKIFEAAEMTFEGTNTASDEDVAKYSDSIAQALKGLQEGIDNLNSNVNDNDVLSMFMNLNVEGGDDDSGNVFLPAIEGMMHSLLSAEVLLPCIKNLLEEYPKYLEDNSDKITPEDKERYTKQIELFKIIEGHLESENPDDPPAVKREKFRIVLEDFKKVQDLGQLPKEFIVDSLFDPTISGAIAEPAAGPQCPTM